MGDSAPYPEIVRRLRRFVALSLIAILVVGTNAGLHAGDDDVCESTPFAETGAAPHAQATAPAASPQPQHCAICHWLESLRAGSVAHPAPPGPNRFSLPLRRYVTQRAATADRFTLPLRAPPA